MTVKVEESNDTPTNEISCSLKASIDSFAKELKCKIELIKQDAKTNYEDVSSKIVTRLVIQILI